MKRQGKEGRHAPFSYCCRIVLLCMLCLVFCSVVQAKPALGKKKVTMQAGNVYVLELKDNNGKVTWRSSRSACVRIVYKTKSYAVLKAMKPGTARISAATGGNKQVCTVTVKKRAAFPKKMTVLVGDALRLTGKGSSTWELDNACLVPISEMNPARTIECRAITPGVTTVTGIYQGKATSCQVTILDRKGQRPADPTQPDYTLRLEKSTLTLTEGKSAYVGYSASSEDRSAVVKVKADNSCADASLLGDHIVVYGLARGKTILTVTYGSAVEKLTVTVAEPLTYSLTLEKTQVALSKGETVRITVKTSSNDPSAKLSIANDKTDQADVSLEGSELVVKGKKEGVASVTVTFGTKTVNLLVAVEGDAISDYDKNVKSINHRGYSETAPENTLPAYILSRKKGFGYAETDISFTKDNVPVLLHDETINRTARNADGSELSADIPISSITYAQALTYDFGIWKSSTYKGTKIPTFQEFLLLCKKISLHPYIELKENGNYTKEQIASLVDVVRKNGMAGKVTWISFNAEYLVWVQEKDDHARLGYLSLFVNEEVIGTAQHLKTASNEVFLDVMYMEGFFGNTVDLCYNAGIPLEVWTIDDAETMKALDPYITGVTSNNLVYGKVLYDSVVTG